MRPTRRNEMKHLKMLGLATLTAMALIAVVGAASASATVLCKTSTNPCTEDYPAGTEFNAATEAARSVLFKGGGVAVNTCTEAKISGKTTNTGGLGSPVVVSLSSFVWGGCTKTTEVIKAGPMEIYYAKSEIGAIGTVTMKEFEWKEGSCTYGWTNQDIGQITGSATEGGSKAKLYVDATYPLVAGGFPCPMTATWADIYVISTPNPLNFAES
jgi:hypothetical protein